MLSRLLRENVTLKKLSLNLNASVCQNAYVCCCHHPRRRLSHGEHFFVSRGVPARLRRPTLAPSLHQADADLLTFPRMPSKPTNEGITSTHIRTPIARDQPQQLFRCPSQSQEPSPDAPSVPIQTPRSSGASLPAPPPPLHPISPTTHTTEFQQFTLKQSQSLQSRDFPSLDTQESLVEAHAVAES